MNRARASFATFLSLASFGCDDPLAHVERIEGLRVLGARVEVLGDPGRASPAPGEHATVRFLVASDEPSPSATWELSACEAAPSEHGALDCAGGAFASSSAVGEAPPSPRLELDVPADLGGPEVAVRGAICDGPIAARGACGDADGARVSLAVPLAADGFSNRNPTLAAGAVTLDGEAWEPPGLPGSDPCTDGSPSVAAGTDHVLGVAVDPRDREPLEKQASLDPVAEALVLWHFTTAGDLDRAVSAVDPAAAAPRVSVAWAAPGEEGEETGGVRFYFVLRDGRGGADLAERAVCVGR